MLVMSIRRFSLSIVSGLSSPLSPYSLRPRFAPPFPPITLANFSRILLLKRIYRLCTRLFPFAVPLRLFPSVFSSCAPIAFIVGTFAPTLIAERVYFFIYDELFDLPLRLCQSILQRWNKMKDDRDYKQILELLLARSLLA